MTYYHITSILYFVNQLLIIYCATFKICNHSIGQNSLHSPLLKFELHQELLLQSVYSLSVENYLLQYHHIHQSNVKKSTKIKVKFFTLKIYFETQNLITQKDELQIQLANEENLRFLVNERSIKLSQEVEKLKISKEKLEEHSRRL